MVVFALVIVVLLLSLVVVGVLAVSTGETQGGQVEPYMSVPIPVRPPGSKPPRPNARPGKM